MRAVIALALALAAAGPVQAQQAVPLSRDAPCPWRATLRAAPAELLVRRDANWPPGGHGYVLVEQGGRLTVAAPAKDGEAAWRIPAAALPMAVHMLLTTAPVPAMRSGAEWGTAEALALFSGLLAAFPRLEGVRDLGDPRPLRSADVAAGGAVACHALLLPAG